MQPSKSKSTRYQPKALYVVASFLFCASLLVAFSLEYDLPWINQALALIPSHNYIHWRTYEEAWTECQKTHKPVIYMVMGKKDPASMLLESQCLGDPRVADLIDSEFIPVHLWVDRKNKKQQDDPDFKYFRNKLGWANDTTPWAAIVPYALHEAPVGDLSSCANLVELGVTDMADLDSEQEFYSNNSYYHYGRYGTYEGVRYANGRFLSQNSGGVIYGYQSKQDFLEFLYNSQLWHKLPPTVGKVKWLPLDKLNLEARSAKPKLLALVGDVGSTSDTMRLNLFWKSKSVGLINDSFEPYLIEYRRLDPVGKGKYDYLRTKYGIKQLPALIVLKTPLKSADNPPIERGYNNVGFTTEFLRSALKGVYVPPQNVQPSYDGSTDN